MLLAFDNFYLRNCPQHAAIIYIGESQLHKKYIKINKFGSISDGSNDGGAGNAIYVSISAHKTCAGGAGENKII
jgi:hypothetical protein